jgi:hypothetical protein
MLRQHAAAKRFDFTEGGGGHACPFQAEAETADAAEQVKDFHASHPQPGTIFSISASLGTA